MIVRYCDVCNVVMKPLDSKRVHRKLGNVQIEIISSFKGTRNVGDICHECIKKVVIDGFIVDRDGGEDSTGIEM